MISKSIKRYPYYNRGRRGLPKERSKNIRSCYGLRATVQKTHCKCSDKGTTSRPRSSETQVDITVDGTATPWSNGSARNRLRLKCPNACIESRCQNTEQSANDRCPGSYRAFLTVAVAIAETEACIRPVHQRHQEKAIKLWIGIQTLTETHPLKTAKSTSVPEICVPTTENCASS